VSDPDEGDDTVDEQLDSAETLTDPRVDILDEGWSPVEQPRGVDSWGVTPEEERTGQPLAGRLRRESPDETTDDDGDGLGDARGTDGELYDDEVGRARSGRLVLAEGDEDGFAEDIGIDGAGASAEEAAVHLVEDPDDR
jgi:Family of unknown function (DUF5709)